MRRPRDGFGDPLERFIGTCDLPLNRGRKGAIEMRVGCGLRVRRIDGNEYLYFWHYEREGGRSERREDYVGPVREAKSRQEAARKLLAFHRRVQQDLGARIARVERTTRGHRGRV